MAIHQSFSWLWWTWLVQSSWSLLIFHLRLEASIGTKRNLLHFFGKKVKTWCFSFRVISVLECHIRLYRKVFLRRRVSHPWSSDQAGFFKGCLASALASLAQPSALFSLYLFIVVWLFFVVIFLYSFFPPLLRGCISLYSYSLWF